MVSETGKSNINNILSNPSDIFFEKSRKNIETYSIIALFSLISSIILLSLNLYLLSGCMIIACASIGIIISRKVSALNRRYKKSINEFSSLNQRNDDVITDFSHKIREPLNNLVIIADMLMESGLEKKQKELLETFIASTNNMVTTVNELSMQPAGNLTYGSRKAFKFNLLSTIQNTIELYNLKDKANIDFILEKKELSDFECYGDPIILKQIFLDLFNTIENQVSEKAIMVLINLNITKETGNKRIISLRLQTDKRIVIIDDIGIEQNLAARFISLENGTFSQDIGDNSTVLTILLPFVNPVAEAKQKIASSKIEELIQKDKIHKELKDLKILLVEDNLINQRITLLTLKPLVKSIDTAINGKEALDKFGTANYDLILMDIQMPVMSGLVATEKIRALEFTTNSHIPILAITANAMIGDKEKCLSSGIDDYISKPFQPAALIEKIKRII
ncbi:MAG TPA: response regulator [Bacteroidales bacterium]|nr:response regulator [Bacteroidales bacterium]